MTKQRKKLLLLIEDNPLLVGMYKAAFQKKGLTVLFAHDGETGIKIATEKKPDLILLDILMPGLDGLSVLNKLRENPTTKNLKVIILTIVTDKTVQERAKKFGVLDYLLKQELKLHEIVERVYSYF